MPHKTIKASRMSLGQVGVLVWGQVPLVIQRDKAEAALFHFWTRDDPKMGDMAESIPYRMPDPDAMDVVIEEQGT